MQLETHCEYRTAVGRNLPHRAGRISTAAREQPDVTDVLLRGVRHHAQSLQMIGAVAVAEFSPVIVQFTAVPAAPTPEQSASAVTE